MKQHTPQWERTCSTTHLTMQQFVELVESNAHPCSSTETEDEKWLYFDYKYMHEWFIDNPQILQTVNWAPLGFPETTGLQSSVWIGSDGAHTPCHMDSYGCNLVAQIYGTKQWILFPPDKSEQMLPTRIPYEESSVYSKHNFFCPRIKTELEGARVVMLKPGDVLFVPHHWWHYVENIGTAISINTWIPLISDDSARLEESLVKLFMSQVCKDHPQPDLILNPNEDDVATWPLIASVKLVQTCVEKCKERNPSNVKKPEAEVANIPEKVIMDMGEHSGSSDKTIVDVTKYKDIITPIRQWTVLKFRKFLLKKRKRFKTKKIKRISKSHLDTATERLINAFCHPDVISKVKDILYYEYQRSNPDVSLNQKR
ncbi:HSPB1-associated protein 1 homolog isoform X2 [Anabrus simplex]|uniref:HSPB1-associated protein 1 homolog isoform X2 n=1 Tax=Anabrus simplex TaxID=316456 RepID=UPI0035A335B8